MVDMDLSIELMAAPHDTCIPGLTGVNLSYIKHIASPPINDESNPVNDESNPATPPAESEGTQENIKGLNMNDSTPPWEILSELIDAQNSAELTNFIETLSPSETARAISRLTEAEQLRLFGLLSPEDAADVIEDIPEAHQAADLVEDMPSEQAAAIMEELSSDHLVDVLGEMDEDASSAILAKMDREDAREARMMLKYAPDCAGGLMVSEFLVYKTDNTIQDVLDDLQANRSEYVDYPVQYFMWSTGKRSWPACFVCTTCFFPPGRPRSPRS